MATIFTLWKQDHPPAQPDVVSPATLEDPYPSAKDWSNQELADLFRVKQMLDRAGVALGIDRGVTDEGDPWFVFCNAEDEVFVHLCRIDGRYLLDSPNIDSPLTGDSFNALIEAFVRRAAVPQLGANVVPLRPRSGVYLHPAIMLTVLVWSIYIAADELVGMAHGAELDDDGQAPQLPLADLASLNQTMPIEDAVQTLYRLENEPADARPATGPSAANQVELIGQRQSADPMTGAFSHSSSMAAAAVAASLTVVALVHGLMVVPGLDLPETIDVSSLDGQTVLPAAAPVAASEETAVARLENDARDKVLADSVADQVTVIATAETVVPLIEVPLVAGIVTDSEPLAATETRMPAIAVASMVPALFAPPRLDGNPAETQAAVQGSAVSAALNTINVERFELASVIGDFKPLSVFSVGSRELMASFDPSSILGSSVNMMDQGLVRVGDLIDEPDAALAPLAGSQEFGEAAQAFVSYLISKTKWVEVIAADNEVIFLDRSAFDSASDVSYARSWVFSDGSVLSTVGNLFDFQAYGLA